jgi:hypothetical protein
LHLCSFDDIKVEIVFELSKLIERKDTLTLQPEYNGLFLPGPDLSAILHGGYPLWGFIDHFDGSFLQERVATERRNGGKAAVLFDYKLQYDGALNIPFYGFLRVFHVSIEKRKPGGGATGKFGFDLHFDKSL